MSKIKEHFHEEICAAQAGENRDYAVDSMIRITEATNAQLAGEITVAQWYKIIVEETTNFQNMHEPWQPQ